jgi:integrase
MGSSPGVNDGSIERADVDGKNRKVIVPSGVTFTPKQIHLDKNNGKLYWCDREGMRVMRCNLDGSQVETLVETGRGDTDRLSNLRLSGGAVSLVIKERVAAAGFDPSGYSGHSLRAGLATSAAQSGAASWKIRQQTGHASDAMLVRYIRDGELFTDNVAGVLL